MNELNLGISSDLETAFGLPTIAPIAARISISRWRRIRQTLSSLSGLPTWKPKPVEDAFER